MNVPGEQETPAAKSDAASPEGRPALVAFAAGIGLVWTALLAAGLGRFSLAIALAGALAAAGIALFGTRRSKTTPLRPARSPADRRLDRVALLLAAASLTLTWPPGESILGGWDPGVYVHTAANLAREGTLRFHHPDLAEMSAEDAALLARNLHGIREPFAGMRLLPDGRVSPQFYHAYPALLACAMKIGGLWAALAVNPLLNALALLAAYALGAGWTGSRRWGLAGMAALAVNPTQIWQARFCTAEPLTQFLLLSAFTLLRRWSHRPAERRMEAALAGAALGLAQLTRYDTLLLLAPALAALLWTGMERRYRAGLVTALGMVGLAALHAWWHQRFVAPYYRPLGPLVANGLRLGALAAAILLPLRATPRGRAWTARGRRPLLAVVSFAWLGWMSFNWIIRPTLHSRTNVSAFLRRWAAAVNLENAASTLIGPNSRSMLYLQSIFGPAALALALLGVLALLWRARRPAEHAWAWGGLGVTLLLTWTPYNDLFMMWVSRRYVPVVIPWLTLGMVVGCAALHECLDRRRPRLRPLAGALFALALLPMLPGAARLARNREWPGLIAWFENAQRQIPPGARMYTDQPGFAAPLRFLWQRRTYELQHPGPKNRNDFYALLGRAARRHGVVYYLTQRPLPDAAGSSVRYTPAASLSLSSGTIQQRRVHLPDGVTPRGGPFALYQVEPVLVTPTESAR